MNAINRNEVSMFKVGDKVVNDAFINSNIYVFKKLMFEIGMALIAHDDDEGACGLYSLRHATEQEIAAGHRIENDMGDDSHIENHISKNCKVIDYE